MNDKILVAVDQSEQSDRAVLAARDLAQVSGGSIKLVHVRERQVVPGRGGGVAEVEDAEDVEHLLASETAVFEKAAVPVSVEIRYGWSGHAAQEIVAAAKEDSADVIVLGSRGRSELTALVLGSTAYKVLHLAEVPVLIVP